MARQAGLHAQTAGNAFVWGSSSHFRRLHTKDMIDDARSGKRNDACTA